MSNLNQRVIKGLYLTNTSRTQQELMLASKTEDSYILKSIAENPNCPSDVLSKLSFNDSAYVRHATARNPHLHTDDLDRLGNETDFDISSAALKNPNLSLDSLKDNLRSNDKSIRYKSYQNPHVSIEQMIQAIDGNDFNVICSIASNTSVPAYLLAKLSKSVCARVRGNVASNTSTPPEVLFCLASEKCSTISKSVINNPSSPVEALERIAKDGVNVAREYLCEALDLPLSVLSILINDHKHFVRLKAIENRGASTRLLLQGANDISESVRKATARKYNITEECTNILAADNSMLVRVNLAQNPFINMNIAIKMLDARCKNTNTALLNNPNCSAKIMKRLEPKYKLKIDARHRLNKAQITRKLLEPGVDSAELFVESTFVKPRKLGHMAA